MGMTTEGTVRSRLERITLKGFKTIRGKWSAGDNRRLKEDAANLAPVLYRLQMRDRRYYQRILDTIRPCCRCSPTLSSNRTAVTSCWHGV